MSDLRDFVSTLRLQAHEINTSINKLLNDLQSAHSSVNLWPQLMNDMSQISTELQQFNEHINALKESVSRPSCPFLFISHSIQSFFREQLQRPSRTAEHAILVPISCRDVQDSNYVHLLMPAPAAEVQTWLNMSDGASLTMDDESETFQTLAEVEVRMLFGAFSVVASHISLQFPPPPLSPQMVMNQYNLIIAKLRSDLSTAFISIDATEATTMSPPTEHPRSLEQSVQRQITRMYPPGFLVRRSV